MPCAASMKKGTLPMKNTLKLLAAALAAAGLLAACGGGDGPDISPIKPKVAAIKVIGDSLSDSGTFGYKFTVQGGDSQGPFKLWTERVASGYGLGLCPHFGSSDGRTFGTDKGCTSYAVGGASVNFPQAPGLPLSIAQQVKAAAAAGFTAEDLVLVDGGANDVLVTSFSFLAATAGQGEAFAQLLGTKIAATELQALLAQGQTGMAQAGSLYMQILAKEFAALIKSDVLGNGAKRVAVLNVPAVTQTPHFRMALAAVAAQQGSAAAEQLATMFDGWVRAFNAQLAGSLDGDKRVALVDFYNDFKNQFAHPEQYQYTNVTKPVCPASGVDAFGLPEYDFPACTATYLSSHVPVGETSAGWWQSYGFSDSFHPTPLAHQHMAELTRRALEKAGWL